MMTKMLSIEKKFNTKSCYQLLPVHFTVNARQMGNLIRCWLVVLDEQVIN